MQKIILISFLATVFISCDHKYTIEKKPIYNSKKTHVGDSVFVDKFISKIIFIDSSYMIDSIAFDYFDRSTHKLKSIRTFKMGENIFENIDYYENGNIKRYIFIDEDNPKFFYERLYDLKGIINRVNGTPFFQGYITNINSENLELKKGEQIDYKIYYPNPPDCKTKLYIKYDDGKLFDVFKKSTFMNFLQTTSNDNDQIGTYKVNILLEIKGNNEDSAVDYNRVLFYKVID